MKTTSSLNRQFLMTDAVMSHAVSRLVPLALIPDETGMMTELPAD